MSLISIYRFMRDHTALEKEKSLKLLHFTSLSFAFMQGQTAYLKCTLVTSFL